MRFTKTFLISLALLETTLSWADLDVLNCKSFTDAQYSVNPASVTTYSNGCSVSYVRIDTFAMAPYQIQKPLCYKMEGCLALCVKPSKIAQTQISCVTAKTP